MVDDDIFTFQGRQPLTNTTVPSLISKERMQKLELLIHLTSNLTQPLVLCGPKGIGKTTLLKVFQERQIESWRYCPVSGSADLSFEAIQGQLARLIKQDNAETPLSALSMIFEQYQNQHKKIVLMIDNAGELMPGLITTIIRYAAANPALRVILALTRDELQVKQGSDRAVDDCHIVQIPYLSEKQCGEFLQHLAAKAAVNGSVNAISESMIENIYQKTNGIPGRIAAEFARLFGAKKSGKLKWMLIAAVVISIAIALGVQWLASSKNKQATSVADEQMADSIEMLPSQPESHVAFELPPPAQPVINPPEQSGEVNEDIPVDIEDEENLEYLDEIDDVTDTNIEPEAGHSTVIDEKSENKQFGATSTTSQPVINQSEQAAQVKEDALAEYNAVEPSGKVSGPDATAVTESSVVIEQKRGDKQADAVQQMIAESPDSQEKPKQSENKSIKKDVPPVPKKAQKAVAVAAKPKIIKAASPQEDGTEWLSSQPADNYTLQLMVSSKQPALKDIRKKYPALGQGFRVIKRVADGKETFILLYGSFDSAQLANTVKQSLAADFRNAAARKIGSLKQ